MIKKWIVFFVLTLSLFSCNTEKKVTPEDKKPQTNIDLTTKTDKKTFLWFVATWCPHCKEEMPIYDSFYKDNKGKVNMQIIVTDGKEFPGNYSIPQDITKPITYEEATKEKCDYIPSYIIYDENKNIIEKKCWAKVTYDELKQKLLPSESITSSWTTLENNQINMTTTNQTEKFKDGDIWVIMTTTHGKIEIKLFSNDAPKTVINFLWLAKKWYYDNLIFHRVIKDFMIQWWDPTGTGMWWESIYGKSFEDEFSPNVKNIRGSISMANAWPNTNGSQFFINQKDNIWLDGKHSVFWQVMNWLENVDKIAGAKTDSNDKPEKEIKIIKMEIVKYESGSLKPYEFSLEENLKKIEDEKKKKQEANKDRVVKTGDKIAVHYIGKTAKDGKEFDNSYTRKTPIEFEVWAKQMIPWFDSGVIGMKIWDKKTLDIKAKDGYGEYDVKNIQEVQKTELKSFTDAGIKLEVWTKLPTMYGEFMIKEVTKDTVKIDVNHFLAGKDLIFDVEMVEFKN